LPGLVRRPTPPPLEPDIGLAPVAATPPPHPRGSPHPPAARVRRRRHLRKEPRAHGATGRHARLRPGRPVHRLVTSRAPRQSPPQPAAPAPPSSPVSQPTPAPPATTSSPAPAPAPAPPAPRAPASASPPPSAPPEFGFER